MRYGADLRWLALAIKERTAHTIIRLSGQLGTAVPEFLGVGLVGHILDLLSNLAVLDFIEQLTAKLEVITLLVNREGAAPDNINAIFDILDNIVGREVIFLIGSQRNIGHALELYVCPALRVATTMGFILINDMNLVADGLVINQCAVFDEVPLLGFDTFVIIANVSQ